LESGTNVFTFCLGRFYRHDCSLAEELSAEILVLLLAATGIVTLGVVRDEDNLSRLDDQTYRWLFKSGWEAAQDLRTSV
jgi:hypothetical protein